MLSRPDQTRPRSRRNGRCHRSLASQDRGAHRGRRLGSGTRQQRHADRQNVRRGALHVDSHRTHQVHHHPRDRGVVLELADPHAQDVALLHFLDHADAIIGDGVEDIDGHARRQRGLNLCNVEQDLLGGNNSDHETRAEVFDGDLRDAHGAGLNRRRHHRWDGQQRHQE